MRLTAGDTAPSFHTEDVFGNVVSLAAYSGKSLLLSFFRNSACAMCNLQVHRLIEHYPDLRRRGLEVVAVFESPKQSVLTNVTRQNAPFPIVADPDAALYDLYGVEVSQEKVLAPVDEAWRAGMVQEAAAIGYPLIHEDGSNFFRLPADFLIGPNGKIEAAFYSEAVGEHLSFAQIDAMLTRV